MGKLILLMTLLAASNAHATYHELTCVITNEVESRAANFTIQTLTINGKNYQIPVMTGALIQLSNLGTNCQWTDGNHAPTPAYIALNAKDFSLSGSTIFGNGSTVGGTPGVVSVMGWNLQPNKKYRFYVDENSAIDPSRPTPQLVPSVGVDL